MVQAAEKTQVFTAGEAREKAQVGARMVAQMTADRSGLANGIKAGDDCRATRGEQKRSEYAEQRRLACAVGAEQSYRLARLDLQRNAAKCR